MPPRRVRNPREGVNQGYDLTVANSGYCGSVFTPTGVWVSIRARILSTPSSGGPGGLEDAFPHKGGPKTHKWCGAKSLPARFITRGPGDAPPRGSKQGVNDRTGTLGCRQSDTETFKHTHKISGDFCGGFFDPPKSHLAPEVASSIVRDCRSPGAISHGYSAAHTAN